MKYVYHYVKMALHLLTMHPVPPLYWVSTEYFSTKEILFKVWSSRKHTCEPVKDVEIQTPIYATKSVV